MIPTREAVPYPFADYADDRYPLLKLAAADQSTAASYKVEWIQDEWVDGRWDQQVKENFTQIVRTPFTPRDDSDRDLYRALEQHLSDVEMTLWFGTPSYERSSGSHGHPLSMCGGVLHYLGRAPIANADIVRLRVMQDCVLLKDRGVEGHAVQDEFLSEFSLQVIPAPTVQPYVPKTKINAWVQGASL